MESSEVFVVGMTAGQAAVSAREIRCEFPQQLQSLDAFDDIRVRQVKKPAVFG
jgi:hypothetical protein